MKGIYLIAIAFLASWTVIVADKFKLDDECPSGHDCPPTLIPIPDDCTRYYECEYGNKILRYCPPNRYFSLSWRGCVRYNLSDCAPDRICDEDELYEHECECRNFYYCKNNEFVLRKCPNGQHFSPTSRSCVPGSACVETAADCQNGEKIAHECVCQKYYLCINGRKALRECQYEWHFDDNKKTCVPGSKCDDDPKPLVCINGETNVHDCVCDKYYKCRDNEWILQTCSNGQHFSPIYHDCRSPEDAGCDRIPIKPGDCPPNPLPNWSHECDCRLFYQCINGKKQISYCKWGYYYDANRQSCEPARNVINSCRNSWDDWL